MSSIRWFSYGDQDAHRPHPCGGRQEALPDEESPSVVRRRRLVVCVVLVAGAALMA